MTEKERIAVLGKTLADLCAGDPDAVGRIRLLSYLVAGIIVSAKVNEETADVEELIGLFERRTRKYIAIGLERLT